MWPSTSCPLSSLTRNMVLGRASVISPSISIFSSLAMRQAGYLTEWRPAGRFIRLRGRRKRPAGSPSLEGGVAGAVLEERADRVLQVLGREEAAGDRRRFRVGLVDAALEVGANQPLGRPVGLGRAIG